jgi:hypothetical protein
MNRQQLADQLINAAVGNDIGRARMLIAEGADVNHINSSGWTAAMYAAWCGHNDFINFLIENNADMSIVTAAGQTAKDLAAHNNKSQTVEILDLYMSGGLQKDRAVKKNEVTVVSSFGTRTLEETFNFAVRERISIVCAKPGAVAQAVVREHFSTIVDQSGIEKAFALYKEYGGTLTLDDVFPDKIHKARMPGRGSVP